MEVSIPRVWVCWGGSGGFRDLGLSELKSEQSQGKARGLVTLPTGTSRQTGP